MKILTSSSIFFFLLLNMFLSGCIMTDPKPGYDCEYGDCVSTSDDPTYKSLSECENYCGGGSSTTGGSTTSGSTTSSTTSGSTTSGSTTGSTTTGPATGKFWVKIYTQPGGDCGTSIKHSLRFYMYCGDGQYKNSVYAGIWSTGEDSGGKYMTCLFGDEGSCICGTKDGVTYYCKGRLYRLEYVITPDKLSYPNSCVLSGVSTIDFNGQTKNVIIDWY